MKALEHSAVAHAFEAYPPAMRRKLLALRTLRANSFTAEERRTQRFAEKTSSFPLRSSAPSAALR